ncbi:MAG: iron ABC transporter permease [Planctomycetes bacterium]|nr:iron ABC transporter permease [Planctomycetota bacterium]
MKPAPKRKKILLLLVILAVLVLAGSPLLAPTPLSIGEILRFEKGGLDAQIFWDLRLPRVCLAFLAGAGLAVGGMAFQAVFRNPLATPFTLGVSSGASFGAALYVYLGIAFSVLGLPGVSIFAFIGGTCSILLVYSLTRLKQGFTTATLLLAGVAISFFFSSLILFIQYLGRVTHSFRILRWLMGGLDAVEFDSVLRLLPFVLAGVIALACLVRELNLLTLGDEIATARGMHVPRTKKIIFFATSLMVGGIVSLCGPIGFVGMIVPHICRLLVGPDHRVLLPATLLFGGTFLVLCDALSRSLIAETMIPVGVITALFGAPFFLWLLLSGVFSERS